MLAFDAYPYNSVIPSADTLFNESGSNQSPIENIDATDSSTIPSERVDLSDSLFFIQFTPENTLRRR